MARIDNHKTGNVTTAQHASGAPSDNIQRIENKLRGNPGILSEKGMTAKSAGFGALTKALQTRLGHVAHGYSSFPDEGPGGKGQTKVGENVRFVKIPGAQAIAVVADVPKGAQGDDRAASKRFSVIATEKNGKGEYVELLKGDVSAADGAVHFTNKAAFYDSHRQPRA